MLAVGRFRLVNGGGSRVETPSCEFGLRSLPTEVYNGCMVLSWQEESLISVIRTLPPGEAVKVFHWAQQLRDLADGRTIEWSDLVAGRYGGCDQSGAPAV